MDFHVELARAARNEVLEATVEAYRELLVPSIRDLRDEKSGRATQKAHEELVEAVRRHDPEGARDLMLTHLADFEKRLRRGLSVRADAEKPTSISKARLIRARR
jgi:DNA-binding FadR family transcriptional regulator